MRKVMGKAASASTQINGRKALNYGEVSARLWVNNTQNYG